MSSLGTQKIQNVQLNLWARFHPDFSHDILIPEIEAYSMQYNAEPLLVDHFRKHQHAKNSLYFLHGFAYDDIPVGQKYDVIMRMNKGVIEPDSAIKCRATVLCFFSEFKTQLIANAYKGHHAGCQIQFHDGIPDIVQELYEITEKKPIEITQELCLCSLNTK